MFSWTNTPYKHALILFWSAFIAISVTACSDGNQTSKLYNIDSLLVKQVTMLAEGKPKLNKLAALGSTSDTLTYVPDSTGWSRELEIFHQLDVMNKPVHKSKYLVDDNLYDLGSNLTVKAFTALERLPVRSVRVFYDTDIRKPRKVEAIYDEENTLYKSSKNLLLEFQQINNKTLLTSYSIDGGQKMILSDSVTFSVKGRIQF